MFPSSCQVLFLVISPGFFVRFAIAFVVWYDSPYQTWANSPKILYFIVKGGTAMEKLYEQDAYLRAFDAKVLSCVQGKGGWDVILDRTAFYPEGGGQPYDTGTLGGVKVLQVHTRGEDVVHTCDGPLEPGSRVSGQIDWDRRFDLMQNHSGEHIVSGIANAWWGCDNVGFHMGSDFITIDLNTMIDEEQLRQLEEAVNRYLWQDKPVLVTYPTPEELEQLDYRSKKALTGQVRIITFPGADVCACCGTHVSSAGQIGLVKLVSVQKFRDGVRIELLCGGRALDYLSRVDIQNKAVSNLLSAKAGETAQGVQRLLEENATLKSRILTMEEQHFAALAHGCAGAGDVVLFEDDLSPDALRRLCDAVLGECQGRCACFSGSDETGYKYAVGQRGGDLRTWVKTLNQTLNGRGGGKPDFVQGSLRAPRADIEAFLEM